MIEKLLGLLGASVDKQEIKNVYEEFGTTYPKK